jgi:hypothetical protein
MEAATLFFLEHHRPMTLVIDGVDALAREQPTFFDILQDFAKTAADSGTLCVVFVSSDKAAVERMKPRSSWSRARRPLEVGDVPDADAVAYLVKRGVSIVTAGKVEIVLCQRRVGPSLLAILSFRASSF